MREGEVPPDDAGHLISVFDILGTPLPGLAACVLVFRMAPA
jgi:hypothetical protein